MFFFFCYPGRDPRPEFKTATFAEGVETMNDLVSGMILEGTVTNVTNFGAFVDIGVHQDGLVHISSLSDRFVEDPHTVVKTRGVSFISSVTAEIRAIRSSLSCGRRHRMSVSSAFMCYLNPGRRSRGPKTKNCLL